MSTHAQRLMGLWDMLKDFAPIYLLGVELEALRQVVGLPGRSASELYDYQVEELQTLLANIKTRCSEHGLTYTAEMAERLLGRPLSNTNAAVFTDLNHLHDLLESELRKESVFRIPRDRVAYYEADHLFGEQVAAAFPSCERDIKNAGSCYALEQPDACVHLLMLVLERGLHALSGKVGVVLDGASWQFIIDQIETKLRGMPRGPELDFYRQVKAQFGFLKDAYRNHSEHVHEPYDLPMAHSTLDHVERFMRELANGGLSE